MSMKRFSDFRTLSKQLVYALVFLLMPCAQCIAESRVALVIGNQSYKYLTVLENPQNDARLISDTLRRLGFSVMAVQGTFPLLDADIGKMRNAVTAFVNTLNFTGSDTVALFYFAGHGVQADGKNFLLPVDAPDLMSKSDLEEKAISADYILKLMNFSHPRIQIVILDACRDNPFGSRSSTRGLALMDAPSGSLIAYATSPGKVASDGRGKKNSPYSYALAFAMANVDGPVEEVFREVGKMVQRETEQLHGEPQIPWTLSSLTGEFSFKTGAIGPKTAPRGDTVPGSSAPKNYPIFPTPDPNDIETYEDLKPK